MEAVSELIEELDGIQQQISEQALEHVHSNEVILTFGYCRTVHLFLREAAKKRQFQVVVAEGAPAYEGQKLARDLASDGINTTCITDSAVFAMMGRANMVVIGAHAVLANGGMLGMVRATWQGRMSPAPPRVCRMRSLRCPLHVPAPHALTALPIALRSAGRTWLRWRRRGTRCLSLCSRGCTSCRRCFRIRRVPVVGNVA